jgi:hypothetical protein
MISEAKREASRNNGHRSRGPKMQEGRARASRNAVRHGLSRPAGLDPVLSDRTAGLARARMAGRERFEAVVGNRPWQRLSAARNCHAGGLVSQSPCSDCLSSPRR